MLNKVTKNILKAVCVRSSLQILEQVAVINDKLIATNLDIWFEVYVCGIKQGLYRGDMAKKTGDFIPYEAEIADWPEIPQTSGMEESRPLPFAPLLKHDFKSFAQSESGGRRPALCSVMYLQDGSMCSTDGHKFMHLAKEGESQEFTTNLPASALKALKLMNEYGHVEMRGYRKVKHNEGDPNDKKEYKDDFSTFVIATAGPARMIIKCVEISSPQVNYVLEEHGEFKRLPGLANTIAKLKEIEPYVSKRTGQVIFDGSRITAKDTGRNLKKEVSLECVLFPSYRIGFNINFLLLTLQALAKLGDAEYAPGSTAIGALHFRNKGNATFILMPLRILDEDLEPEPTPPPEVEGGDEHPPEPEPEDPSQPPGEEAPPPQPTDTDKTEAAIKAVAENIEVEEFPNPPAPPHAIDKPATFKQVKYLVYLTGKKFPDFKGVGRKRASAMITELTKE